MPMFVYIRGGGDLASGVAFRLHQAGFCLLISELPEPLVIRRSVSFAETVYRGQFTIEGINSQLANDIPSTISIISRGEIPVIIDPGAGSLTKLREHYPHNIQIVLVDARMMKEPPDPPPDNVDLYIGLGPGFHAGSNCDVVIETNRGHNLGRIFWKGSPEADTGIPAPVSEHSSERVVRAPTDGILTTQLQIGDHLDQGGLVAQVSEKPVYAPISGVLRGLIHPGIRVLKDQKIADIDPRDDPKYCNLISDKSLAVGGAVLAAILSRRDLRPHIWDINCDY